MKNNTKNVKLRLSTATAAAALAGAIILSNASPVLSNTERTLQGIAASSGENETNGDVPVNREDANFDLHPGVTLSEGKITYSLPGIPSKSVYYYDSLPVSVNGRALSASALVVNNMTYVPLRQYFEAIGAKVNYNSTTRTLTVTHSGLYLTASDGGYVMYANDRPIFNFSPNTIMSNGRMYAPLSSLMKITGQSAVVDRSSVKITGTYKPLKPAASYYREDEVFWLARIITAEARGESLLGMIAVGNVIMNRVASPLYPNTIYGVIFDRKYGVQFSPVLDGSIYTTPTYTATLAAKIILEGTRLSEDSLFFLNPTTAESGWIVKNREYLYSIGGHDFYL